MATYGDVSRCQWLFLVSLIVDVPGALSQRPCTDANGFTEASSYFFENYTTVYPMQYGDCSFGESLCNYTQFCTDQDAESWRQNSDHAECPGKDGRYESFSVLVSPLLDISHLMFRARTPDANHSVQLRAVKLQQGSCTESETALDLLSEFQEHASEEAKMAICDDVTWRRWLYLEYLIVCVTVALSQRPCTDANGFIQASSYFLENHTTAYPMQYGDCSFGQSLCNYTQFCTDQDAESWRQNGDHAECPGKSGWYESFSVLVSPLLCISHVTCLTFEYTQELPGTLSVYLATTTSLFIIMPEEVRQKQSFVKFTTVLSSTAGKLVFRARSPDANHTVQLRDVRLQQGSCTGSGFVSPCTFEPDDFRSSCGWSLNNWNITNQLSAPQSSESIYGASGYFAYVMHPTRKSTLTTSMAQPTESRTGCLEYRYILCGPDSRLLVSIETLDGNRRVLWSGPPNTSTDCLKTWQQAQVPVSSSAAFVIIFENAPANSISIVIAVDSIRYTVLPSPLNCQLEPQHAQPHDDDVTLSPSSLTQVLSRGTSPVSLSAPCESETFTFLQSKFSPSALGSTVSQSTSMSQSQAEHSDQATPIIAGVVAGVVTVIAFIVVLIIIVTRKRRQKKATGKSTNCDRSDDEVANNPHRDSEHPLDEMNMENKKDSEISLQPEGDYYDIAEDGVPGSTRNRGYILSPGDTEESRSISWNSSKNKKDVYSQVHKQQKKPQEMYAQVHKMKKKTGNIGSKQDSRECLNPSYSPETYELTGPQSSKTAATQDDEEYNDLNFEQSRQGDDNCSPCEASGQTYSHLKDDVLYDCAKVEHNRHGANMVFDSEYNHLVT
ncbi:uncharacterized protein LOC112558932 [Pomacea canaliculata]|uniref:uncharacterized protein LOC112558932 n=1 Tax=Pomacea canaliculata TaxID=400727 RepID=UPI000D72AC32|nr:uncharacterized protein LOC112558932 [Pomacea canaliculata]